MANTLAAAAADPTETDDNHPIIAGYAVMDELGRGPLGKVYRARHVESGQMVVFRGFTRPEGADEERWRKAKEHFRELLESHKKVDRHPNIQDIIAFGDDGELFYIASEYFEGRTLRQIIDTEGPKPLAWVLPVFRQVADAVDYAAEQGLSHTDLTPYTILITNHDNTVRVINFGLGRARSKSGSPYAAPEQISGAEGDSRSDVYAVGALLYEVLSGKAPFTGETPDEINRRVQTTLPEPLRDQPGYVRDALITMLSKYPTRRYGRVRTAIDDLIHQRIPKGAAVALRAPEETAAGGLSVAAGRAVAPSLQEYSLSDQDLVQIHRRLRQAQRDREETRGHAARRIAWAVALAAFVGIVAHAVSSRGTYRTTKVAAVTGKPLLLTGNKKEPLVAGLRLNTSMPHIVSTDSKSTVLLQMRGARVKVGADSALELRQIGYAKGAVRRFGLNRGRIWASVDPLRGGGSVFEVACRGVRVLVKGTQFTVAAASPSGPGAKIATFEGKVRVATGKDESTVPAGRQLAAVAGDSELSEPTPLAEAEKQMLANQKDLLAAKDMLTAFMDWLGGVEEAAILPVLDLASGGGLGNLNPAQSLLKNPRAVAEAQVSMQAIAAALVAAGEGEAPNSLTLNTLEELGMEKKDRERLLATFHEKRLLSYKVLPEGYEFTARAKDSKGTLLRARNGKVSVLDAQGNEVEDDALKEKK